MKRLISTRSNDVRNKSKIYIIALLLSYILMMIPQCLHKYASIRTALYTGCYILSISLIIFALTNCKVNISKNRITLFILYVVSSVLPLFHNLILNIDTSINDYLDLPIKLTTCLLYFVLIPKQIEEKDIYKLYIGISIIMLFASAYNFLVNINGITHLMNIENSYQVSFSSFFANRNTFAMYLLIGIFSTLITINKYKSKKWKIILLIQIVSMLLTMSRGGIIATIVILLPTFMKYMKSHKKIIIPTIGATILIITCVLSNNIVNEKIQKLYLRSDAGASGRMDIWEKGVNYTKQNGILTGSGYYTTIENAGINQFHSFYIDTLVEGGLIVLIAKTLILSLAYKSIEKSKADKNIKKLYKYSYISILILGLFESVNIFALGSTEMMFTISYITMPILIKENKIMNGLKNE